MASFKKVSPLRQLSNLISDSVSQIDAAFKNANIEYPNLDLPLDPNDPSEQLSMSPEVVRPSMLIVAACAQLGATVKVPVLTLYDIVGGFHITSALRVALESNVVEILRETPNGLHAKDLAARNCLDPTKITRVLRILSTHHVFREISPDVFTNNRLSSMMDTLKPVKEIQADPVNKHVDTPGIGALIELSADEVFKGSAFLTEVLLDPKKSTSEAPEDAPMMVAFKSRQSSWEWQGAIGFKWGGLPKNTVVVDVGGGLGHTTMNIAEGHTHLKFIVQDRPAVIEQAKQHWEAAFPDRLKDRSVQLQGNLCDLLYNKSLIRRTNVAHDFFTPQIVKNPGVYICRMVCHDYGKTKATQILSHLRNSAIADTKLLLIEQVVPYACLGEHSGAAAVEQSIPGAQQLEPPKPLLANLGKANSIAYIGDLQASLAYQGHAMYVSRQPRCLLVWAEKKERLALG
ncbi:hypothetical protein ONZ45_g12131 [Pleurotus djamor]|nr:hypothetical protein ONZ45_g12131 [Pleurotus djamor]